MSPRRIRRHRAALQAATVFARRDGFWRAGDYCRLHMDGAIGCVENVRLLIG